VLIGVGFFCGLPNAGGDTVLDFGKSYKASLADRAETALPKSGTAGYNDAAALGTVLLAGNADAAEC
jgi:hypothetical protein